MAGGVTDLEDAIHGHLLVALGERDAWEQELLNLQPCQ